MPLYTFTPRRDNLWIWLPILGALLAFPLLVKSEYILNVGGPGRDLCHPRPWG